MSFTRDLYGGEKVSEARDSISDAIDLRDLIAVAGRSRSGAAEFLLFYFIMRKLEEEERRKLQESLSRSIREDVMRELRDKFERQDKIDDLLKKLGEAAMTIAKAFFMSKASGGSKPKLHIDVGEGGGGGGEEKGEG